MNDYELAITRIEAARLALHTARKRLEIAEDEMAAAERHLTRHESSPGIPLPRYRMWSTRQDTGTIQFAGV